MEQKLFEDDQTNDGATLAIIRRRRWYLWGLILIYIPAALTTLQYTQSYRLIGILFSIWLLLLCTAVMLIACAKCPRCGNRFHMRDSSLSFLRKCSHCGLHIKEDQKESEFTS